MSVYIFAIRGVRVSVVPYIKGSASLSCFKVKVSALYDSSILCYGQWLQLKNFSLKLLVAM